MKSLEESLKEYLLECISFIISEYNNACENKNSLHRFFFTEKNPYSPSDERDVYSLNEQQIFFPIHFIVSMEKVAYESLNNVLLSWTKEHPKSLDDVLHSQFTYPSEPQTIHKLFCLEEVFKGLFVKYFEIVKKPIVDHDAIKTVLKFILETVTARKFWIRCIFPLNSSNLIEEEIVIVDTKNEKISLCPAKESDVTKHYTRYYRYTQPNHGLPYIKLQTPLLEINKFVHLREINKIDTLFYNERKAFDICYSISSGSFIEIGPPIYEELTWSSKIYGVYGLVQIMFPDLMKEWTIHSKEFNLFQIKKIKTYLDAYRKIISTKGHKPASVAAERFLKAIKSRNPTNSIMDYMIGFEALFLHENETTELSRTLKQRVAIVLGREREEKNSIQIMINHGYDARSQVVHGEKWRHISETNNSRNSDFDWNSWHILNESIKQLLKGSLQVYFDEVHNRRIDSTAVFISMIDKSILETPSPFVKPPTLVLAGS